MQVYGPVATTVESFPEFTVPTMVLGQLDVDASGPPSVTRWRRWARRSRLLVEVASVSPLFVARKTAGRAVEQALLTRLSPDLASVTRHRRALVVVPWQRELASRRQAVGSRVVPVAVVGFLAMASAGVVMARASTMPTATLSFTLVSDGAIIVGCGGGGVVN